MTQPHPIFQKELDAFREHERDSGRAVYDNQLDLLLSALQRASLAVVEEKIKEVEAKGESENPTSMDYSYGYNKAYKEVLEILTSPNTGTLQG